jgi:hypothetical protein
LPLFYRFFVRVRRDTKKSINGLLKASFLFEGPRTFYTLSLWKDEASFLEFGKIYSHISAARLAFIFAERVDVDRLGSCASVWSAQFRLRALSHNLNWAGFDLRQALSEELRVPPEQIAKRPGERRAHAR